MGISGISGHGGILRALQAAMGGDDAATKHANTVGADGAQGRHGHHHAKGADGGGGADEARGAKGAENGGRTRGGGGGCDKAAGANGAQGADDAEEGVEKLAAAAGAIAGGGIGAGLATEPATGAAPLATAATGSSILAQAAASVPASAIADQVFGAAQAGGAQVDVLDDAAFSAKYGRASGVFDPNTNRISIPKSVAADPAKAGLVLLHEGVHWLQSNTQGGIDALGGAVTQALQGASATSTAATGKPKQQQDEAQAYLLEALAANQAGIRDGGMGTTTSGKVASYTQILGAVQSTPEYA